MSSDRKQLIEQFFESVGRMHRLFSTNKELFLTKLEINRAQLDVLFILKHKEKATIKELSQQLHITSSATTQLINALEKRNFVERTDDKIDRRVVHISLTKTGRECMVSCKKAVQDSLTPKLVNMTDEELQEITKITNKLVGELARSKGDR